MPPSNPPPEALVTVARVCKTQGRHGEVAAEILTDFPERFSERKRFYASAEGKPARELHAEDHWFHKGLVVLKFEGIDDINAAETLIGCELRIGGEERAELEPDAYYLSDLSGCEVLNGDRPIGTVTDVDFGAGEVPLLVVKQGDSEYLVPFAKAYLKHVDVAGKRIEMQLPEGLLDLDAPLTEEEKKIQHRGG